MYVADILKTKGGSVTTITASASALVVCHAISHRSESEQNA